MKIVLNNKAVEVKDQAVVYDLLQEHFMPQAGIAVAVNNKVVTKSLWESYTLQEGDKVAVIQAACGG